MLIIVLVYAWFKWFVPDLVPQKLYNSLIHLKFFRLEEMSFYNDGCGLTFLVVLIKNSPNLEEIELEVNSVRLLHPICFFIFKLKYMTQKLTSLSAD